MADISAIQENTPRIAKRDPFSGIRFKVKLGGKKELPITKVSGIAKMTELMKYREGSDDEGGGDIERKMLGANMVEDVTLEKLYTGDNTLEAWYEDARTGDVGVRINVTLGIFDKRGGNGGAPTITYQFKNAIPIRWEVDEPDASRTEPLKERLVFAYEILSRTDAGVVPSEVI